ncbi:MAG: SpoIVB peptidase S55 domain-containing protein, partial [Eubacteriales bacterium]
MSKTKKAAAMFFAAMFFALAMTGFSVSEAYDGNSLQKSEVPVAASEKTLIAAGIPFGVRIHTDGVIVVNLTRVGKGEGAFSPAAEAGIRKGDVIISVNGEKTGSAKELCDAVENSEGKQMNIIIKRGGREKSVNITASADEAGLYKIGVLARDTAAGIGTVTFIDPETGVFAGLGHGICDAETGELIPLSYGTCEDVVLTDIIKGKSGVPGELRGFFSGKKTGKIINNSYSGVFGVLSEVPSSLEGNVFKACGKGVINN